MWYFAIYVDCFLLNPNPDRKSFKIFFASPVSVSTQTLFTLPCIIHFIVPRFLYKSQISCISILLITNVLVSSHTFFLIFSHQNRRKKFN
jgi:hypothetical protein